MMLKLAWRNLWRRKRRTLITASSIAFGLLLAVTFTGAGDYFHTRMIDAGARMSMGHVTIAAKDYIRAPSSQKRLANSDKLQQLITKHSSTNAILPRIQGQAMFASAYNNFGGTFIALDPGIETKANNLFLQALVKGDSLTQNEGKGVLIGTDLANKLKLDVGNKLVYTTTDSQGNIVSAIARVKGLFRTGIAEVDGALALMPLKTVQTVLNFQSQEVSFLALHIDDQRNSAKVRDQLQQLPILKDTDVMNWQQTQTDLAGMIAIDKTGNRISQLLIAVLIAAGVLNTMLMSVLERIREFGIMLSLGMTPRQLFSLVILESFFLGLLGLIIGTVVTVPWYLYMTNTGIDLSSVYGQGFSFGSVLIDTTFKIRLFSESLVWIVIGLLGLTLLASCYPALRAGRIVPVESLKAL